MNATELLHCRQEKFSITQWKFISNTRGKTPFSLFLKQTLLFFFSYYCDRLMFSTVIFITANSLYCAPDEADLPPEALNSTLLANHTCKQANLQRNKSVITDAKTTPSSSIQSNFEDDIPSFNAITDGLRDAPPQQMTGYQTTRVPLPISSTYIVNSGSNYPMLSNHNSPFLYSNSPLRPCNINSAQTDNRFGTPHNDPGLYKLLEDFEAECKRNDIEQGKKKLCQNFSSASVLYQNKSMQYQQVIFSTPVQTEFYKTMSAALPHLDSRYLFSQTLTCLK